MNSGTLAQVSDSVHGVNSVLALHLAETGSCRSINSEQENWLLVGHSGCVGGKHVILNIHPQTCAAA